MNALCRVGTSSWVYAYSFDGHSLPSSTIHPPNSTVRS
jgi:hypothetical protein